MPGPRCTTRVRWSTPTPGTLISDAEVAEVAAFTAFGSTEHPVTARLIVRRVRDRARTRRAVPGLAVPPVPHQQPRAGRGSRHHPPPARDHRDRVRRPDRRTAGPPAVGPVRREQRLGDLRGDHPQPAPRRRHPGRPQPMRWPAARPCAASSSPSPPGSPDRNAARCCTYPRTGPGPIPGRPCGTASSATARATDHRLTLPTCPPAQPGDHTVETLGRPAAPSLHHPTKP